MENVVTGGEVLTALANQRRAIVGTRPKCVNRAAAIKKKKLDPRGIGVSAKARAYARAIRLLSAENP